MQVQNLRLMPWQKPPCHASLNALAAPFGGLHGERESAELLQRLIDANLSRYEPDPIAALGAEAKPTKSGPHAARALNDDELAALMERRRKVRALTRWEAGTVPYLSLRSPGG
jgi:hypothetical protein